jgi:hypothetical protein
MANKYVVRAGNDLFEPYSDRSEAKSRAENLLEQGHQAYIEMYLDVGLISGAGLVKYEYWDQEYGSWVTGDTVPDQKT